MQATTRRVLVWALWCTTLGCCAAGLAAPVLSGTGTASLLLNSTWEVLLFPLPVATLGLVLVLRLPGNPLGWLYCGAGLAWSLVTPWSSWLDLLADSGDPLPPAAQLAVVVEGVAWAPALALGLVLPALLLPDGRLRSRRWRSTVLTTVAGVTLLVVGSALSSGPINTTRPFDNPLGLPGAAGVVADIVGWIGWGLLIGSLPAAAVCVLLRFRSSRGSERQQLRWIAAGAAVSVVSFALAMSLPGGDEGILIPLAVLAPITAIAVAVLRYRLWDLDRLVSRTVTYALVTGLLVLPYLLIVPAVTRFAANASDLAVAGATLAAAALFQPLRGRVQRLVDRRFNRRRYDAARIVEAFAARLRQQVDLDALSAELLAVIDRTVQSRTTSLWLRPGGPTR